MTYELMKWFNSRESEESRADLGGVWAGRPFWEDTLSVARGNAFRTTQRRD